MKGQTSFWQKLALISLGLTLCFLLLETSLQVSSFFLRPTSLSTNTNAELRLLCLGESTTAWGGENAYPEQLQRELQKKYPQKKIAVFNRGVPGTSTAEISRALPAYLEELKPHYVLLMMGVNDFWANDEINNSTFSKTMHDYGEFLKSAKLLRLVWANFFQRPHHSPAPAQIEAHPAPSADPFANWIAQTREYLQHGEESKALQLIKAVVQHSPLPSTFFQAGLLFEDIYQQQEKRPELRHWAKHFYREAIKREPHPQGDTGSSLHLALILHSEKKWQEAKTYYEMAAVSSVWAHTPRAQFYLAEFYESQKMFPEAIKFYERAGLIKGEGLEVYWNWKSYQALIRLWSRQNDLSKVRQVLARAQRAYPNNSALRDFYHDPKNLVEALSTHRYEMNFESGPRNFYQAPQVVKNYRQVIELLWDKKIVPVVVSYPRRELAALRQHFSVREQKNIVWVENSVNFEAELKKASYDSIFVDRFAGDFGHASPQGNLFLAKNIAQVMSSKF